MTRLADLDTPALVVDLDVMEANMARIAEACRAHGVAWRPHCKTHKSPEIAHLQMAAGAIGVTCAKLAEAEVMVAGGITDVLVANQVVGAVKIERLMGLLHIATIAVAVDDAANVAALAEAASRHGLRLRVLIEVDTGTSRAGVQPGAAVLALAQAIGQHTALQLGGLMTWEGHTTRIAEPAEKAAAITAAIGKLTASAALCRAAGIPIATVSCGGTGTFETAVTLPGVTEIQAGGGIFSDVRYRTIYNVDLPYGLTVIATVTSRPNPHRIVCDAGKKALSTDSGMPLPLDLPPIRQLGFSAEHAKIELESPSDTPRLGDQVRFVVGYSDTTVHMHPVLYGVRGDRVEATWPIRAEAKLR